MSQIYPEMARKGMAAPSSEACGECHTAIYEEWQDSVHAKAWTHKPFVKQTMDHQLGQCLACHAPEPIRDEPVVTLREHRRDQGVNCLSCHLVDGELAGPEGESAPHPARGNDPFYRSSAMCGTCHVSTYREWTAFAQEQVEEAKTCQACHMPTVHRKTIQDNPWHWLHGKNDLRQHTFTATDEALLSKAVVLEIRVRATGRALRGTVRVTNVGVGHSIPPAGYGYREAVLTVRLVDGEGRVIAEEKESWFAAKKTSLAPGERREMAFTFEYNGGPYRLVAALIRANLHGETKAMIAQAEQTGPAEPVSGGGS